VVSPPERRTEAELKKMNRRELLKLSPVALAAAFTMPALREPLLDAGVRFSDWASGGYFSPSRHRRFSITPRAHP